MHINWSCIWSKIKAASEVVEYVSWVSASIFAVLAIFTIFLAYQFQTNVADSRKMIWNMREGLRKKNKEDLIAAREEFTFLQTKLDYITNSIQVVKDIIGYLIYIWVICGIAMMAEHSYSNEHGFNPLKLFLILSITALFVYFALELIKIIKRLSSADEENEVYTVGNIYSLQKLKSYNWVSKDIVNIMDPSFEFIISGDQPLSQVFIKQSVVFNEFGILLSIVSVDSTLYVGTYIDNENKKNLIEIEITSSSDRELLNRFMNEGQYMVADISLSILIGKEYLHYKAVSNSQLEGTLPFSIKFVIDEQIVNSWLPPRAVLDQFEKANEIFIVN